MIKKITSCDLLLSVELSVLEAKIFGTTWHPNTIKEKINSGEVLYWVYEIDNEIVAYLSIQKNIEGLHILAIGVKEEYRNQSIARNLTIELVNYFQKSQYKQILLEVRVSNSIAIKLYESFGFKHYGVREKYYKNEDASLFRLEKAYV